MGVIEPKILFFSEGVPIPLKRRKALKAYIKNLFLKEGKKLEQINCIFCSDEFLLSINKRYLQHDYYTDIITFDLSETSTINGELYLSVQRVKENASLINLPFNQEICRVLFHGVLHLCGYNDKTPDEISIMKKKENFYLQRYFKAMYKR